MRRGIGCAGLGCGVVGLSTGLFALFFDAFIYPSLAYDSPLNYLSTILWLCNTLFIGLAVCIVALGLMAGHEETEGSTSTAQPAPPAQPVTTHYLGLASVSHTPRNPGSVPPPISSQAQPQATQRPSRTDTQTPAPKPSPAPTHTDKPGDTQPSSEPTERPREP